METRTIVYTAKHIDLKREIAMLENNYYDNVKLLYELSKLCWFIEKHAKPEAQQAGDPADLEKLQQLQDDLHKYIEIFKKAVCS